ncbi:MAG: hypothetical protein ACK559_05420, partial [bacterium]
LDLVVERVHRVEGTPQLGDVGRHHDVLLEDLHPRLHAAHRDHERQRVDQGDEVASLVSGLTCDNRNPPLAGLDLVDLLSPTRGDREPEPVATVPGLVGRRHPRGRERAEKSPARRDAELQDAVVDDCRRCGQRRQHHTDAVGVQVDVRQ